MYYKPPSPPMENKTLLILVLILFFSIISCFFSLWYSSNVTPLIDTPLFPLFFILDLPTFILPWVMLGEFISRIWWDK